MRASNKEIVRHKPKDRKYNEPACGMWKDGEQLTPLPERVNCPRCKKQTTAVSEAQ